MLRPIETIPYAYGRILFCGYVESHLDDKLHRDLVMPDFGMEILYR